MYPVSGDRISRCHYHERAARASAGHAGGRPAPAAGRGLGTGHLPAGGVQDLHRRQGTGARPHRHRSRPAPRRDARPGRRVGQREDHPGPGAGRAVGAGRGLGARDVGVEAGAHGAQAVPRSAAGDADHLPEPRLRPEPAAQRAGHHQPAADQARRAVREGTRGAAGRTHRLGPDAAAAARRCARPSCPEGSSSASPSRARSPGTPGSSSATSPPRRSTCRCRRRSSTCSPTCRGANG